MSGPMYTLTDCSTCTALWLCLVWGPPEFVDEPAGIWQRHCRICNGFELTRHVGAGSMAYSEFVKIKLPKCQTCCTVSPREDYICDECREREEDKKYRAEMRRL